MLSQAEIRKWLASLVKKGGKRGPRGGISLNAVAKYLNVNLETVRWLSKRDTAQIGIELQREFSKLIGLWENGMLETKRGGGARGNQNIIVPRETPRVMLKYQVKFGPGGPSLQAAPKPKLPTRMPTVKELLGRGRD